MSETAVQKVASLHEKAVQAVASGEVAPLPQRRRQRPEKAFQPPVDKHVKVHPEVWRTALGLLGESYTRIDIIDEQTVVVR